MKHNMRTIAQFQHGMRYCVEFNVWKHQNQHLYVETIDQVDEFLRLNTNKINLVKVHNIAQLRARYINSIREMTQ